MFIVLCLHSGCLVVDIKLNMAHDNVSWLHSSQHIVICIQSEDHLNFSYVNYKYHQRNLTYTEKSYEFQR